MKKIKFLKSVSRQIIGKYLVVKFTYSDGSATVKRRCLQ